MYALLRNVFAVFAVIFILFRTVTAFQKAQNEISTRATSAPCDPRPTPDNHEINIIMERSSAYLFHDEGEPNISVKIMYGDTLDSRNCSVLASKELGYSRTLDTFICPSAKQMSLNDDVFDGRVGVPFYRIHIEVSRSNSRLNSQRDIPSIWLSNGLEQPSNLSSPSSHPVRAYLPAWVLRPGYHIDAEVKLISRRLIKSSILQDVVLNSKPTYTSISLYPISEVGLFNNANANTASAELRVTLRPGYMYFGAPKDLRNLDYPSARLQLCDYLDDYRSGTILEVTFTLGAFCSRRFKSRLKDEYHSRSSNKNAEPINMVKFLRDFVIDFGPADFDPEYRPSQIYVSPQSSSSSVAKECRDNAQIPLMQKVTTPVDSKEIENYVRLDLK
ncbi:transmembrane protein [Rhizoctonia solani]|uniref:Transmembrane protein n=1 Tax=Rhizoctonia solani TaxID=456999 RepID=A0A8H8SW95_9AGAM|nr:uncharacterized protein RhiXN_05775 [Rhizoctonia solani]QRW20786.1 transmembrane protein [Rhizoctonia solani]